MALSALSIGYIVFYSFTAILIIFTPLLCFQRSRIICYRRIRERRWNVDTRDLDEATEARPRYPPDDPRYCLTKEEAMEVKKKYMTEHVEGHSMILKEGDFIYSKEDDGTDNSSNSGNSTYSQDIESQPVPNGSERNNGPLRDSVEDYIVQDSNSLDEEQGRRSSMTFIKVPSPSIETIPSTSKNHHRCTPIECSICLLDFQVGDNISWSSLECPHVFHRNCILKWMFTLGEQNDAKRIRRLQKLSTDCDFDIPCPVCRMNFIPSQSGSTTDSSHSE